MHVAGRTAHRGRIDWTVTTHGTGVSVVPGAGRRLLLRAWIFITEMSDTEIRCEVMFTRFGDTVSEQDGMNKQLT